MAQAGLGSLLSGGKFRLAELIDVMGLDVALDEKTLERLRSVLSKRQH
jgi:hypothetical protein